MKFTTSYQRKYPEKDINKNWFKGDMLEKKLAEKKLFFFMKYIYKVDDERWDDDYHWDMCEWVQNIRWCDNCKHFKIHKIKVVWDNVFQSFIEDVRGNKYQCHLHRRSARPFYTCDDFEGGKGIKGCIRTYRKMALYPRESLKTTILIIGMDLWSLCKYPDDSILNLTQTERLARKNLKQVGRHIEENKKLRRYWPELVEAYENAITNDRFILELKRPDIRINDPSIEAKSIDAHLEGGHFMKVKYDDPIGKKHAESPAEMDKAKSGYEGTLPLREKKFEVQMYVATIQGHNDLTTDLIESTLWDVQRHEVCWIIDPDGTIPKNGFMCRQVKVNDVKRWIANGEITDDLYFPYKKWWNKERLLSTCRELKNDWNYLFCQYWNRPAGDPTKGFFKEWIVNMTEERIVEKFYPKLGYVPWDLMFTCCNMDLAPGKDKVSKTSDIAFIVWSVDCFERYFLRYSWIGKETVLNQIDRMFELQVKFPEIEFFSSEAGKDFDYFEQSFEEVLKKVQAEARTMKKTNFIAPQLETVKRGNINKIDRIIKGLQPLYEMNGIESYSTKVIHVGDTDEHKKYENSLLIVGQTPKEVSVDGPDAASDISVMKEVPDMGTFEREMERLLAEKPDIDRMTQSEQDELKWAFNEGQRQEHYNKYGVYTPEEREHWWYR